MASKKKAEEELCPGVLRVGKAYRVRCRVNGTYHYCNEARMKKLIAKHGSMEKVGEEYVSRAGKTILRSRTTETKEPKQVRCGEDRTTLDPPRSSYQYTRADELIFAEVNREHDRCLRARLFQSQNGHCNGCRWWGMCNYPDKKWSRSFPFTKRFDALERLSAHPWEIRTENEEGYTKVDQKIHNRVVALMRGQRI